MTVSVRLPRSGMGITEGTITQWLKAVGDRVEKGEAIAEVETAKAVVEVEAPVAGVLRSITCEVDETVEVESEIATIDEV